MYKDQILARVEFSSLAKFVADVRVSRPQAWRSVERLKPACALEATPYSSRHCDTDDLSSARTLQDLGSGPGQGFDVSGLATWLSAPDVWPSRRDSDDLVVCEAFFALPAAGTDWFVAE
ncbi:MAG: hypothetical protein M3Z29_03690 [Pseudomonadota bacterium]|nr:hypothetical protein [Pseudomonadota bacterium]